MKLLQFLPLCSLLSTVLGHLHHGGVPHFYERNAEAIDDDGLFARALDHKDSSWLYARDLDEDYFFHDDLMARDFDDQTPMSLHERAKKGAQPPIRVHEDPRGNTPPQVNAYYKTCRACKAAFLIVQGHTSSLSSCPLCRSSALSSPLSTNPTGHNQPGTVEGNRVYTYNGAGGRGQREG
ncbi:hypothetical protein MMC13_005554 [Lambiella insularis]|nr:hypothetical protein [Lambiella insularis]